MNMPCRKCLLLPACKGKAKSTYSYANFGCKLIIDYVEQHTDYNIYSYRLSTFWIFMDNNMGGFN